MNFVGCTMRSSSAGYCGDDPNGISQVRRVLVATGWMRKVILFVDAYAANLPTPSESVFSSIRSLPRLGLGLVRYGKIC